MIHRPRMIINSSSEHMPKFKLAAVQNRSQVYKVKYYGIKACQKNKLSSLNLHVIELAQFVFFNEQCLLAKATESGAKSSRFKHGPNVNIIESIVVKSSSLLGFSSTQDSRLLQLHPQSSSNMIYGLLNSPLFLMGAAGRKQFGTPLLIFLVRISKVYFTIAAEYYRGVFFIALNFLQGDRCLQRLFPLLF